MVLLMLCLLNHLTLLHFLGSEFGPVFILLGSANSVVGVFVEPFFGLLLLDLGYEMRLSHGLVDSFFGLYFFSL